jgi:hypothetical protein
MARKTAPDRVILASVEHLAAPGASVTVHINGVTPRWSWEFGSAPTCFQEELNKVEIGHVASVACITYSKGVAPCGLVTALTFAPRSISRIP